MGYILPVIKYEYSDYQNRLLDRKKNYNYIEKPYKVVLYKLTSHTPKNFNKKNNEIYSMKSSGNHCTWKGKYVDKYI